MNQTIFLKHVGEKLLEINPKLVVLSGPSGFLGSKVVQSILDVHDFRRRNGVDPGELILLSSSPGRLMERFSRRYNRTTMASVRASRVDYYTQHDTDTWKDHLGSLGVGGPDSVFVNLAAVAGPQPERSVDAMKDVNYHGAVAAASACEQLQIGHFIQVSTQATNSERSGQVPYSKWKAMADYAISKMTKMPSSIILLGLVYSQADRAVGQGFNKGLNMIDLSLLPLTPILGSGSAAMQPIEVADVSYRITYLAMGDPASRPVQNEVSSERHKLKTLTSFVSKNSEQSIVRVYDAVGPEEIDIENLFKRFARYQGKNWFKPVHIGYRNMEKILNITSLGNLNRQFVSLLRSEQEATFQIVGTPDIWNSLLGDHPEVQMRRLDEAFPESEKPKRRYFPLLTTIALVWNNPKLIPPGIALSFEIIYCAILEMFRLNPHSPTYRGNKTKEK